MREVVTIDVKIKIIGKVRDTVSYLHQFGINSVGDEESASGTLIGNGTCNYYFGANIENYDGIMIVNEMRIDNTIDSNFRDGKDVKIQKIIMKESTDESEVKDFLSKVCNIKFWGVL